MRVLLDGKQWGLPDTEEAQLIVEELEGHIIAVRNAQYVLKACQVREMNLFDRIKEMSLKHTRGKNGK